MASDQPATEYMFYRGPENTSGKRDHIVRNGDTICNIRVNVPPAESLKPVQEMVPSEWSVVFSNFSNLCSKCASIASSADYVPDDLPDLPEFECMECNEPADFVRKWGNAALVYHRDLSNFPNSSEKHSMPWEIFDEWRQNPEEFLFYPAVKRFIDNNRGLFRQETPR